MAIRRRHLFSAVFLALSFSHCLAKDAELSLQWAICDTDAATVLQKLHYSDQKQYKSNPVVYYDGWPPHYTKHGLAFRTKVKKHDPGYPISMIKARFKESNDDVPSTADCRWDRYGNDTSYTCGMVNILPTVGDGAESLDVWSEEQRDFASIYQDIVWEDLVPFGPYMNPKWKLHLLGMKAVFDDVRASPLHLMEIEITTNKGGGDKVYEKVDSFLREKGVVLCEKQLPKTLRLLDFLVEEAEKGRQVGGNEQIVVAE